MAAGDDGQQNQQKRHPYYGGGMPKGYKTRKTLEKEAALEALRQMVSERLEELTARDLRNPRG